MSVFTNNVILPASWRIPTPEEASILKVLAYFDIFQYPLTKNEIRKFMHRSFPEPVFEDVLRRMLTDKIIFQCHEFYSLHDNTLLVHRRKEGNHRAQQLLPKGFTIGRFLFHFPYVRAVCISGSLSKNFADKKADIDFFIITKANRLWLARTIMHLFKKLTFLTGHQHYFCMNYYIDEKALLIEAQNIFTAMEITTLLPVSGSKTMDHFFLANDWSYRFFPRNNHTTAISKSERKSWVKQVVEWMLDNKWGDYLDERLFKITTSRWQKKSREGKRNKNGRTMYLITGKHFSRSNPGAFQEKVLSLYEQRLRELKLV